MRRTKFIFACVLVMAVIGTAGAQGAGKKAVPFKFGFSIWGTSDGHGRYVTEATKWAVKAMGGDLVIDTGALSPDAQITSIENLIQAGCKIVSFCAYTGDACIPKIAQLCKDNGVYFVIWDTDITDPKVKQIVEANPYYVGNTNEDQFSTGYDGVAQLAKLGVKNLVLVKYGIGVATCDDREKGALKAAQEKGIKIAYTIIAPEDAKKAMQDVLVSHPEVDGLFVLGGTESYLSPMNSAIAAAGKSGKVRIASIDFSDAMKGMFASKSLDLIYGGHIVTSTFAALMAVNAYYKTPLSAKPYKVHIPYLKLTSSAESEAYYSLVVGSVPPYNADELKKFVKYYNDGLTLDSFQKMVSQYSISDIQARHR